MSTRSTQVYWFFHRPRRSYYARVTIPLSLRHYFNGRIESWRSLGTRDRALATVKASQWNGRRQTLLYKLKTEGHTMQKEQIEALIARWMDATYELFEELPA